MKTRYNYRSQAPGAGKCVRSSRGFAFAFASYWLRKCHEFCRPIQGAVKRNQSQRELLLTLDGKPPSFDSIHLIFKKRVSEILYIGEALDTGKI